MTIHQQLRVLVEHRPDAASDDADFAVGLEAFGRVVYEWPIDDRIAADFAADPQSMHEFVLAGIAATWHVGHGDGCAHYRTPAKTGRES